MTTTPPATGRQLPVWGFLVLVVGYLAAIQLIPRLTAPPGDAYASFPTTESVVGGLWVTVAVGSLIGLVAVAVLGWWRPVFVDDHRLPQRFAHLLGHGAGDLVGDATGRKRHHQGDAALGEGLGQGEARQGGQRQGGEKGATRNHGCLRLWESRGGEGEIG